MPDPTLEKEREASASVDSRTSKKESSARPLQLTSENSRRVRFTRAIMRILGDVCIMKSVCKVSVNHLERVPRQGPTIILYNHMTYLDPVLACAPIRFRDNVPIGKEEIHAHLTTGWITWMWQTIPLKRDELDLLALRRALYVLEHTNDILSIAPEGHRYKALGKPKEGFVMLAAKTNAVIVPVGLSGQQHVKGNLRRLRRTPITVTYGRPLRLKGKISRAQYTLCADEIMFQIGAVLPPELRGEYSAQEQATMNLIEYVE